MKYNLTSNQKELAKWIWSEHEAKQLPETFKGTFKENKVISINGMNCIGLRAGSLDFGGVTSGSFNELCEASLLSQRHTDFGPTWFTIRGELQTAVESDFADDTHVVPVSTLAHSHPTEIAMSIDRLRERFPDPKKLGFLIMRFAAEKPYCAIVDAIKKTAEEHGLVVIRADDHEFHADLLSNVRTYLHGCGFGIAVYERIQTDEPNANVGFEVGYLMAMGKPVLLLKDKTAETLQSDLAGRLYKQFDPHDAQGTIPAQMTKWLEDYGIIVPKHP